MGRFAHLPAQLQRPGVRGPHLRRSGTLRGDERFAQSDQKLQFLSGRLRGVGQLARELQSSGQMSDRFQIGRALARPLPGPVPVVHRLVVQTRRRVVLGEQLGLGGSRIRKPLLEHPGDASMELLTSGS